MDRDEHVARLVAEATSFADTVDGVDLGTTVVSCPDWKVRDLARHVGGLHRWATSLVRDGITTETWRATMPIEYPDATDAWAPWIRDGVDEMAAVFLAADPTAPVWAWGGDQHARFWPRRMLFETAIHRLDLALTLGVPPVLDAATAVEGMDELLDNLRYAARWSRDIATLTGEGRLLYRASDTGHAWRISLTANGWFWDRGEADADVRVTGPVLDLVLLIHGRPAPGATVEGDDALYKRWTTATAF
jgi:uncharacterized protein (TIGR03083 family)